MLFCRLLIFSKSTFQKNSFKKTIRVSNSLDPDQARHFVGPGLGPSCLQSLSADNTSRQRVNFSFFQELIKMHNESDAFFYSNTYDLTNSIQQQYAKSYEHDQPLWKRADARFFWNKHMLNELIEQQVGSHIFMRSAVAQLVVC